MLRRKDLPDYLTYRGNRLPFHRLADGPSLGRLDPYAPGEQAWPMLSGHEISVTAEEIRDITYQVLGITLPPIDPRDVAPLEARIAALEAKLGAAPVTPVATVESAEPEVAAEPELEPEPQPDPRDAEIEALRARIAELESRQANAPEEAELPGPEERLSDWGDVEAEQALTTNDLLGHSDEVVTDVIAKLTRDKRKRFTELLNVELAELQLDRDGPKEDRKREAKIERLLGMFARVGEM